MQIDFQPPHHWQELNEQAAVMLGIDLAGGAVKLVPGLPAALNELTMGLVKQFPHKRKVYFFKDLDPALEAPAATLSKDGCVLQTLDAKLLKDPKALAGEISSDALMIVCSEDDPLLGRLQDLTHLETVADSKKIFLVRVSHAHHRFLPLPKTFARTTLRIHSVNARLAVIFHSARMRWPIQFAESVALPGEVLSEVEKLKRQDLVNPQIIEKFESAKPADCKPVFATGDLRIPDRAVVYWPDMDGFAVITKLAERLKIQLPKLGENTPLETTSLNRWRGVRTMDWLRPHGFTDEMIRGTVIIDHRYLNAEMIEHLNDVRAEILKMQNG